MYAYLQCHLLKVFALSNCNALRPIYYASRSTLDNIWLVAILGAYIENVRWVVQKVGKHNTQIDHKIAFAKTIYHILPENLAEGSLFSVALATSHFTHSHLYSFI